MARMTLFGSKRKSGTRNAVYSQAANHVAYYHISKKDSIYYDGQDLKICLLFDDKKSAHLFVNSLLEILKYSYVQADYAKQYDAILRDEAAELVFKDHYDPTEYADSATGSTVVTELPAVVQTSLTDEQFLMTLEKRDHSDFRGLNAFRCHLIGQAVDKTFAENENNVFFMSWPLHQRFDGLNSSPLKNVPSIAIRFHAPGAVESIYNFKRQKAVLIIECVNVDAFQTVCERLKHPFTPNQAALEIETFVHPEDMAQFIECVTYKYEETKAIWEDKCAPGQLVDESTATELRTTATQKAGAKLQERRRAKDKKSKK